MPDAPATVWILQADSDWAAAERVYKPADAGSYCQTIAKYQQVVEKSVKAVFAKLKDKGIIIQPMGYLHNLNGIFSTLKRLPQPRANAGRQSMVNKLFDDTNVNEINELCALAPKRPVSGTPHLRNTEYPYEISMGVWTYPAAANSFSTSEVSKFKRLAEKNWSRSKKLISQIDKKP